MVKLDDKIHQDIENKFNGIIRGDFSIFRCKYLSIVIEPLVNMMRSPLDRLK